MDPDTFTAALFKWDTRGPFPTPPNRQLEALLSPPPPPPVPPQQQQQQSLQPAGAVAAPPPPAAYLVRPREYFGGLEDVFQPYGVRYYTAARMAELGFTVSTLVNMKEEELEEMMDSLSHIFRWELLVGERYGIKAAVRAERRRLEDHEDARRRHHAMSSADAANNALDALSQEGLSEEQVQQDKREAAGSGGGGGWEMVMGSDKKMKLQQRGRRKKNVDNHQQYRRTGNYDDDDDDDDDEERNGGERQREHPFIVTEPGEVARGKKNGLDYLFHLYEQCREFLIQVQTLAKDRGEKCPNKVTNQVFRYAKRAGATYINKPKMRHYVHCYALHCLDEAASNALRRSYKERGENVGAWRQACYKPVVDIAARQAWDIDAIFSAHPRLSIWYVPTRLRQLCHAERSRAAAASTLGVSASAGSHHLPF